MTNASQVKINTVVVVAFVSLYKYRKELFKALLIPILFFIAIEGVLLLDLDKILYAVIFIINIIIQTQIAITTHRIMLLGSQSVPTWGIGKWTEREFLFLIYFAMFSVLMSIPYFFIIGLFALTGMYRPNFSLIYLIFISIMFGYVGRLALVFPAIAVDKGETFKRAWELTRDYKLFMFLILFVVPIIILLPVIVLMVVFSLDTFVFLTVLYTLAIVVGIALLSFAYKLITEQGTHDPHPPI